MRISTPITHSKSVRARHDATYCMEELDRNYRIQSIVSY